MEPPAKRKPARYLSSWTLPPGITASTKGPSFAYCKFCKDNFCVTHGVCNDIKCHVQGKGHEERYKEVSENKTMESFTEEHVSNLSSKIIFAEVTMSNFIAQQNLHTCQLDVSKLWDMLF